MTTSQTGSFVKKLEKASQAVDRPKYVLKLFITGSMPRSTKAIINVRQICKEYLKDRFELEIVDIITQPVRARDEQIIAAPTLIKKLPLPLRRFVGDMSDTEKILLGLDLRAKK
jgi:circadian clock protein KaiB